MKRLFSFFATFLSVMSVVAQGNTMTPFPVKYGENYQSISFNGGWGESFNDQAIYISGEHNRTYTAWIDLYGDVVVGSIDSQSGDIETQIVVDNRRYKRDDFALTLTATKSNNLVLALANLRGAGVVEVFTAVESEDIKTWKRDLVDVSADSAVKRVYAINYPEGELSLMALTNGGNVYTTTFGTGETTWSKVSGIVMQYKTLAGDIVVRDNGRGMVVARVDDNQLFYLKDGQFTSYNKLFDRSENVYTIYDFVVTEAGEVVVVYKGEGNHVMYKSSDNRTPRVLPITNLANQNLVIDRETPTTLYYTGFVANSTEVFVCAIDKKGKRWSVESITERTPYPNLRVVAIKGACDKSAMQVCWTQQQTNKDNYVNHPTSIKVNIQQPKVGDLLTEDGVVAMMNKVADWQISTPYLVKNKHDWHWCAFYRGLMAAHQSTGDSRYLDELMNVGQSYDWGVLPDFFHADRLLICDIYSYLYEQGGKRDREIMAQTEWVMNQHVNANFDFSNLVHTADNPLNHKLWTWCDALYMGAPSFFTYTNVTGDESTREFGHEQFTAVADFLYSKADSLFYRDNRFFTKKSTNGGKLFWSRGNGWLMGALPRIIDALPEGHEYRPYYIEMYKEMAHKILNLQRKEGIWTVNLLDPEELLLGESSGSGFFGYALAWGVNRGILDAEVYGPAARRAWVALCGNVSSFGRLGYVQATAGEPFPFFEYQSHTYASGAFLMFASEMLKMVE